MNEALMQKSEFFDLIADKFRLLSDPQRLRLLNALRTREQSVGELVSVLQLSQPSVSKHLKLLHENGLLNRRQDGNQVYYQIAEPMIFDLCNLMCSHLEERMKRQAQQAIDMLQSGRPFEGLLHEGSGP
ncbi:MAG: ArsR/SmtB family transcription factor [Myxococcota bacterium]